LPTSIASSTRRLFRAAHPRADSEQVAVEVDHGELAQAVVGLLRGSVKPRDVLTGQIQALELGVECVEVEALVELRGGLEVLRRKDGGDGGQRQELWSGAPIA
jgi:hypothetical protein